MVNNKIFSSKTNQWETPQKLFDELNAEFHFTLDPCADESNFKCKKYFKIKDYDMILESIDKYDEYLSDNKFALIHNDLHFDNVIYNNGKLTIIDFNDSIQAPIDFEFRLLYMCQEQPWKWADIEMDPYQKPEDYKNIWNYIKKYYKELNEIKFLEQRMIIYRIWNDIGHLKKYHNVELTKGIVENSKKLI